MLPFNRVSTKSGQAVVIFDTLVVPTTLLCHCVLVLLLVLRVVPFLSVSLPVYHASVLTLHHVKTPCKDLLSRLIPDAGRWGGGRFRRPHFLFVVGRGGCRPGTPLWGVALPTYFLPSILVCFVLALIRVVKSSLGLGCKNCLLSPSKDFFPKSICVPLSPSVPYSFILRQRVQGGRMCMKRPSNQILYKVIKFILYLCRMHNLTISSHWSLTNGAITCLGCFCHQCKIGWRLVWLYAKMFDSCAHT